MTARYESDIGFVLHGRPYRETSALVEIFCKTHGRLSTVAKGARRQRSKFRGVLQPTIPLRVTWSGKNELVTLTDAELNGAPIFLKGQQLVCALYMNELLIRLLAKRDPHPELFDCYAATLADLQTQQTIQQLLRIFEKNLLQAIGYELLLTQEARTGADICREEKYLYDPVEGPIHVSGKEARQGELRVFRGDTLLALANAHFDQEETLREAKWLMRIVLAYHLDGKALESRKLL